MNDESSITERKKIIQSKIDELGGLTKEMSLLGETFFPRSSSIEQKIQSKLSELKELTEKIGNHKKKEEALGKNIEKLIAEAHKVVKEEHGEALTNFI